jgi:hypothetical protein
MSAKESEFRFDRLLRSVTREPEKRVELEAIREQLRARVARCLIQNQKETFTSETSSNF